MSNHTPDLQALRTRLQSLERANRRLTLLLSAVVVAGLVGMGGLLFATTTDVVDENRFARTVMFYSGEEALLSQREKFDMVRGWPITWSSGTPLGGHMGAHPDGTQAGAQFYDADQRYAQLAVSATGGSFLHLRDDGRAAFLGTNLHDGQLLLELVSADGQQGVRLGLTADDEPVLEIVRQGVAQSVVDTSSADPSGVDPSGVDPSGVDPSGTAGVGAAPAFATATANARRPTP